MNSIKNQPSFDSKRQTLGNIFPLNTPFNVIIDSSEACNFKCQYCFRHEENKEKWGYAHSRKNMSREVFEKVIEQISEFPEEVKQISLSNHGEPLCNRNIPDMIRYIKKKGISSRVSIHTNASLLTKDYALDLADSDIDRIVVSLQGLSSEKYKEICGFDIDYDDFVENLSILYKNKNHTQIYYKIMDVALNDGEEEKFYETFSNIGDRVFIEKMVPIWKDVEMGNEVNNRIEFNKYGEQFPSQKCCPLLFHTIVVTPVGDVYPCTQLLFPKSLGNIRDNTLKNFWNCKEKQEIMRKHLLFQSPTICHDCFILQNSIYTKEDMIDDYREEILSRLEKEK